MMMILLIYIVKHKLGWIQPRGIVIVNYNKVVYNIITI